MMAHLFTYLLEASICLGVFYVFYKVFLHPEKHFIRNRIFILASICFGLIIPVIEIPVKREISYLERYHPVFVSTYINTTKNNASDEARVKKTQESGNYILTGILWRMYFAVCLLLVLRYGYRLYQLRRLSAKYKADAKPGYKIIYVDSALPTFSFFKTIYWNNELSLTENSHNLILEHELAHIREWHSLDIVVVELLKIIFWFNPIIYLYKKALQEVHEYLANAAVTRNYHSQIYIALIARQVLNHSVFNFTQPFNQSQIKKRIAMIYAPKTAKTAFWKIGLVLPLVTILIVIYSCRTIEPKDYRPGKEVNVQSYPEGVYQLGEIVVVGYGSSGNSLADKIRLNEMITGYGSSKKPNVIYDHAEMNPSPAQGISSFQQYIRQNIKYPPQAKTANVAGKVLVEFIVNEDGSLSNVKVRRGIGAGCDEEAARLISDGPTWNPGMNNGIAVKVRRVVPVSFGNITNQSLIAKAQLIFSDSLIEGQPVPVEGIEAFYKKVGRTIRYSEQAKSDYIEGSVWVKFTVKADGSVSEPVIEESLQADIDQEVLRAVKEAHLPWKVATTDDKTQDAILLFPITFKLG